MLKNKEKYSESILNKINGYENEYIKIGCSTSKVIKLYNNIDVKYLKIDTKGKLYDEFNKIKYLKNKISVPIIITYESDNKYDYLITKSLNGEMLCSKYYLNNPTEAITQLVRGLNEIHNISIKNCLYDMTIKTKINIITNRIQNGELNINDIDEDWIEKFKTISNMIKYLNESKPDEILSFIHGDFAAPNVLILNDKLSYLDLADCGIGDKWYDIAVCEKSIIRNFGKEYIDLFYKKLEVQRDEKKIEYYLLLQHLM